MSPRRVLALLATLAVVACDGATVEPNVDAGLALQIVLSPELATAPNAGTLHVEGPTNRTVPLAPGANVKVDGLLPGSYTVSLEAFAGSQVVGFGQTTATVVAGQDRAVTITPTSFVPTGLTAPSQVTAGQDFTVTFQGVQGAESYVVQWADNAQFTNAQSQTATGTSVTLGITTAGTFFVRVFARTRFGSSGEPATATQVQVAQSNKLENGVPLLNQSGASGSLKFYSFDVPQGSGDRVLQLRILGGSGDADLFLRFGQDPTTDTFDCSSIAPPDAYNANGLDFCTVLDPQAGTWHVMLQGATTYSSVTLDARVTTLQTIPDGGSITGLSGGTSDVLYFNAQVPSSAAPPSGAAGARVISGSDFLGTSKTGAPRLRRPAGARSTPALASVAGTLHLETSGGTGDADLLATPRLTSFSFSTIATWPCVAAISETNEESCDVDGPEAGPWTVMLLGFKAFSGVSLSARFVAPTHVFTVTGTGNGRVTGSGIDCTFTGGAGSGTCQLDVAAGATLTLSATPSANYQFDGWSGAGCSGTGDCTVTVGTSDVSVQAAFSPAAAPTISNPVPMVVSVNSCTNTGSQIDVKMNYADATGDIASDVPVHTVYTFQPSGLTGMIDQSFARNGSASAGDVTSSYCIVFGANTSIGLAISISDMSGKSSNVLTVNVLKPAGANVPAGPSGAAVAPVGGKGR